MKQVDSISNVLGTVDQGIEKHAEATQGKLRACMPVFGTLKVTYPVCSDRLQQALADLRSFARVKDY